MSNQKSNSDQEKYSQQLLRGEISAIETYDQVIEKFQGKSLLNDLIEIEKEHKKAKSLLEVYATKIGAEPMKSSGLWGNWAQFTTGAAKIFGEEAALKALKEGEEHGMKDYAKLLENTDISRQLKDQIREQFIPQQQKHIEILNRLMTTVAKN